MDISNETITPHDAKIMLGSNVRNRRISQSTVDKYAASMERGEWRLNGETIQFDENGRLLNGQHRLRAVIKSGVPLETLVVRGLPADSQTTMDQGHKRTFADMLSLDGYKSNIELAGAVKMIWMLETHGVLVSSGYRAPTVHQLYDTLERHPRLAECVHVPQGTRIRKLLGASSAVALYYLMREVDHTDADYFFERLGDGRDLDSDDPIFVVRDRLQREMTRPGTKMPQLVRNALVIKAWNYWQEGRSVSQLKYQPGGTNRERFPDIRGSVIGQNVPAAA